MLLNCGVGEDSWESLGLHGNQTSQSQRKTTLNSHWKDSCWSSNTLATWCEELTHWKRPWCWERLKAGGEGDSRGWDGWMASPTWWTWVWANSGSWCWTRKPGMLQSMGSQKVGHDWATELTELSCSLGEQNCPQLRTTTLKERWEIEWHHERVIMSCEAFFFSSGCALL